MQNDSSGLEPFDQSNSTIFTLEAGLDRLMLWTAYTGMRLLPNLQSEYGLITACPFDEEPTINNQLVLAELKGGICIIYEQRINFHGFIYG